jgi:pectinesterase
MRCFLLFIAVVFVSFAPFPEKRVTVYLVGDSTMCEYGPERAPVTGWGMPFRYFFDSTVIIENHARGGRSTRTFLAENRWQPIAEKLQDGDYVLIQFGHNDEAKEEKYRDRYTPVEDYKTNLSKFIGDAKSKKANPVLITPVTRMRFNAAGQQEETHAEYSAAVFEVARQHGVPVIDLDKMSRELLDTLGPDLSKNLFMHLEPGEHPAYPEGQRDNTHFNEYGARRMAQLVLAGLKEQKVGLAEKVKKPVVQNSSPSLAGVTGVADTSYTAFSDNAKTVKTYPFIRLVKDIRSKRVREKRNITYCQTGRRQLQLDAFFPVTKQVKKRPAILIIHGGGWRSGSRSLHHPLAQRLAALGYVCFTPEYRLSTEALYPAAVHDLKAALRWIHAHAGQFHIDTSKLAVAGHSAGGELAAFLGTTVGNPAFEGNFCHTDFSSNVQAVVDMDGTLSFAHPESGEGDDSKRTSAATYWFGYSKTEAPELWLQASPLTHVSKRTPPTLFINSSVERMHAGRTDYIRLLQKYGIYTEVREFENSPHSFPLYEPWFSTTVKYIDDFLQKVFGKPEKKFR